jgi:hypothetical protein
VCLSAWLEVGNSCPTCKRILFEPNEPVTQQDINFVMRRLGPVYGRPNVMTAIAAYIHKQQEEHAARHRYHEQEVALQRKKDGDSRDDDNDFTLNGDDFDDFLDSDEDAEGEDDFEDGEYDDDDHVESGEYIDEDYPEGDDEDDDD